MVFKMVTICHLGFLKFKLFHCQDGYETHFASVCQILLRSVKLLLRYHDFVIFKMDFQKFQILSVSPIWGQYASPCQISSKW